MNQAPAVTPRRLAPADLDAVVAIDQRLVGRSRRGYFQRRLEAALRSPDLHVQLAVDGGGALTGYVLARRLAGEFGRVEPALRLEVVGVHPDAQRHGLGGALLAALARWAGEHGVREIRTQASWRDRAMLRFLDHGGFELADNQVMACDVGAAKWALDREPEEWPADLQPVREVDYGAPSGGDHAALPRDRVDVRVLAPGDAALVARIDQKVTGRDRKGYIEEAVREALTDSAVRVSLLARTSGIPAGFVMAKTDLGDYGRTEPVAVLDAIGVDPAFAHHRVGTALLSQLFVNLAALQVERVETVVSRDAFGLLGFLYRVGFGPSPRLGFVKRIA